VALRRRDGVGFTAGDLAMLRVVARIAEIAIQHATALTTATALAQQLQHELQRASQAIDTIHREMSDAAFTLDRGGCFVGLNRRAETLFGECREDLRDRSIWQVFPELAGSAFEQECRRAISERHEVSFEFHWMRTDAWLTVHAFPRPDGLAVYMQDISRLVAANDKLRQAAKIEAIGRLTGGIAHSFNNTLQVIIPNVEVLELDVSLSSDAHMALDAIKRAADSAANLTNQLLAFARRQPLTPQVVDVVRLVDGLDAILRGMLGALIKLEIRRPDALWPVRVDPTQLQDAIINLSINARDAMASGGRLTIEAVNLPIRKPEIDAFGEIKPGNYVVISVSDTGIGIPKELLGNVFEPFFSTKPSGRGTGLGLAIVYGFVQQSGGHAKITSEVGRGTTVRLYLPSTAEARAAAGEPPDSIVPVGPNLAGGSEAILVVEDSEGVREVVTKDLSRLGYRVGAAADAEAALEMIEQGFSPDLLLTDVQLPGGLNGMGLGEMVRQQRPEIRVLYMSGYVEDLAAYADRLDPQTNLLRKPFSRAKLAARVRMCLDSELKSSGRHDSTE
jgi:PAS domain S-box-containing protein